MLTNNEQMQRSSSVYHWKSLLSSRKGTKMKTKTMRMKTRMSKRSSSRKILVDRSTVRFLFLVSGPPANSYSHAKPNHATSRP
jgi:hypothetical protein